MIMEPEATGRLPMNLDGVYSPLVTAFDEAGRFGGGALLRVPRRARRGARGRCHERGAHRLLALPRPAGALRRALPAVLRFGRPGARLLLLGRHELDRRRRERASASPCRAAG